MPTQIPLKSLDLSKIRAEWNNIHSEYHELVVSIPPATLKHPTIDTQWSIGEILAHMIQSLEMMPRAIEAVRRGKDYLNLPITLVGATNYFLVRLMARNITPQALLARYDRAFNTALQAWDRVRDDEWSRGAGLFGEGYKTLLDYYMHGSIHFKEHAAHIRKSLTVVEGQY
jgi:hypothetical protein